MSTSSLPRTRSTAPRAWAVLARSVGEASVLQTASSLTLVLLLLYSDDFWYLQIPLTALLAVAIVFPRFRTTETLWFVVCALLGATTIFNWYDIDNHKFLYLYWCLALYVTTCLATRQDRLRVLAASSRLLIGLVFLLATIWKFLAGDYLDGSFFHFTLLADDRLEAVSRYFGGLSAEALAGNDRALAGASSALVPTGKWLLESNSAVVAIATFMTWWNLIVEGAIALAFLVPPTRFFRHGKDALLLAFLVTTYLVAPVTGFGSVLAILGFAQASGPRMRIAYLGAFFAMQVYNLPTYSLVEHFR